MSLLKPFSDPKWKKLKKIKTIGKGWMGEVVLCRLDKQLYVVKMSKVTEAHLKMKKKGIKTPEYWRELYFCEHYGGQSLILVRTLDYEISDVCNFKHPMNASHNFYRFLTPRDKKYHQQLAASPYCLMNIQPYFPSHILRNHYEELWNFAYRRTNNRIDTMKPPTAAIRWLKKSEFQDQHLYFTQKMFYGWIIDIMRQTEKLHSMGFSHRDIHSSNILILDAPINGLHAILIDFGRVSGRVWGDFDPTGDIGHLFWLMGTGNYIHENHRLNKLYGDKKFPIDHKHYLRARKKFVKDPRFTHIIDLCAAVPEDQIFDCAFEIAEHEMGDEIKALMHPKYEKEIIWSRIWLIDRADVMYYLKHAWTDLPAVIERFTSAMRLMN